MVQLYKRPCVQQEKAVSCAVDVPDGVNSGQSERKLM